ncbi:hypothetical protein RJ639_013324 [Escallonia herrerae]|uniref:Transcription factor CBF/NF-Y/archaeal histone domain-containing protein n=1 Tax=Escallonia herrerae TaxID=1293975 RepID=A0AA88VG89_9ASTE|nr:hypothetical protein RJ639_013324 [Escallonia herrerae]
MHGFFLGLPLPAGIVINNNNDNEQKVSNEQRSAQGAARNEDQYIPITKLARIMRRVLPAHATISDDAKKPIQECVSEFINFITSEAIEKCQREHRKTLTAEDILYAMHALGFEMYIAPLTTYLNRLRQHETEGTSVHSEPLVNRIEDNGQALIPLSLVPAHVSYGEPQPVPIGMGHPHQLGMWVFHPYVVATKGFHGNPPGAHAGSSSSSGNAANVVAHANALANYYPYY